MQSKSCFNCKHRTWGEGMWMEQCMDFEMCDDEKEMVESCQRYEFDDREEEEDYCPSATNGDYSPSCPWNAPGMSIRDFI